MPFGSAAIQKHGDQIPAGLAWVDGISRSGGEWVLDAISVTPNGHARSALALSAGLELPLADTQSGWFAKAPTAMRKLEISDLSRAETLIDPADVLRDLVPGIRPSKRHTLFQVSAPDPVYLPALLLIRALFAGSKALDRHLLVPNAIDLMGVASLSPDAVEITAGQGFGSPHGAGRLARVLGWAATCPDAKRAHASVALNARRGEIGLALPKARLSCWAYGYELETGFLPFELSAVDIRLPIPREEVRVYAGGETHRFPSHVAQKKSPWSTRHLVKPGDMQG